MNNIIKKVPVKKSTISAPQPTTEKPIILPSQNPTVDTTHRPKRKRFHLGTINRDQKESLHSTFNATFATAQEQNKKGKISHCTTSYPTKASLYRRCKMKPSLDAQVSSEPIFDYVTLFLFRDNWLDNDDYNSLAHVDIQYLMFSKAIKKCARVDFSPLREPRTDYADQTEISQERIIMMTACAIHYGLDFGLVVRYLGGEYTGEARDVDTVVRTIEPWWDCF